MGLVVTLAMVVAVRVALSELFALSRLARSRGPFHLAVPALGLQLAGPLPPLPCPAPPPLQTLEVQLYRAAHLLFQRLGTTSASCRMCLAAVGELGRQPAAGAAALASRLPKESRLWATAFGDCLDAGRFHSAYATALANPVPEVQIDCIQRLVHALCGAEEGGTTLLCRLPFAQNVLVRRMGPERTHLPCWE